MSKSYWGLRDSCGYGGSTRAQLALAILADTAFMRISTIADLPPQLVLEWMRRLRDGKLVEAHWVLFRAVATIIRLLPDEERALLECYVTGSDQPASFQQLFDTMEVPTNPQWPPAYKKG